MFETLTRVLHKTPLKKVSTAPLANPVYLDALVDEHSPNCFYTGFSGNITDGGIFIATYDIRPLHTPAVVRLNLYSQYQLGIHGVVQWVREYNPQTPEIEPGMGIKFTNLDPEKQALLNTTLRRYAPYFFDDAQLPLPPESPIASEEKTSEDLSGLNDVRQFVDGLTQAIDEYQKHSVLFNDEMTPKAEGDVKRSIRSPQKLVLPPANTIRARVISALAGVEAQFQGGFSPEGPGQRVFIHTDDVYPVGSELHVSIDMDNQVPIRGWGQVVWARKHHPLLQNHSSSGVGIQLDIPQIDRDDGQQRAHPSVIICEAIA